MEANLVNSVWNVANLLSLRSRNIVDQAPPEWRVLGAAAIVAGAMASGSIDPPPPHRLRSSRPFSRQGVVGTRVKPRLATLERDGSQPPPRRLRQLSAG